MGSLQPIGQPIIQSEKLGLELRVPSENRVPGCKVKWSGREKRQVGPNGKPSAFIMRNISVQSWLALVSDTCLPTWSITGRKRRPFSEISMSARFQQRVAVGGGPE